MKQVAIGVDIGGSHIYCAAVDLATHQLIPGTASQQKIDNKADKVTILEGWAKALRATIDTLAGTDLKGIGFAMPGPFDYSNGIALFERVEKYESLYRVNVGRELRKRLMLDQEVAFRYINDATAFAIAESWVGKAGSYDKVIALTLGTGFGSAFIDHGIPVLQGASVPAMGCVWHLPYKDSIANDFFSTHWFTGRYQRLTGRSVSGVKELAEVAVHDPMAMVLFEEYGTGMGQFLAPWILQFDAKVIVIGGNITGAYSLFGHHLQDALKQSGIEIPVLLSDLKEDAAVIGGARLIVDEYYQKVKNLLSLM
jgi:glucokinase